MRRCFRVFGLLVLAMSSVQAPVRAQRGVAPGDRVRVLDPSGQRIADGVLEELGGDSIIIVGRTPRRMATSVFADPGYRLQVRTGTQAARAAVVTGSAFGALGFLVGYCFQLFEDGCARDSGNGFEAGIAAGAVGALVGGLVGLAAPRYERVGPEFFGQTLGASIAPAAGGGLGLVVFIRP